MQGDIGLDQDNGADEVNPFERGADALSFTAANDFIASALAPNNSTPLPGAPSPARGPNGPAAVA